MRQLRVFGLACALIPAAPNSAQDILDLPWRTDETGRLEWQEIGPSPTDPPGRWQPMFPGLLDGAHGTVAASDQHLNFGAFVLLPLLLTGAGGGAAIDEAPRRLQKLGILASFDARAVAHRDSDPLRDVLRTRHLGTLGVSAAGQALAEWAGDTRRDPFVRAGAFEQLRQQPHAEDWAHWKGAPNGQMLRNGSGALLSSLTRLPNDFDLLLGVHSAALPTPAVLLQAWRQVNVRIASMVVLGAGASLSRTGFWTGQSAIDYPGQLPHELAVRFGNWRVDHALIARRRGKAGWWFHLGGVFDPTRIANGLDQAGFDVTRRADGTVDASVCGWEIHTTATGLEGREEGTPVTGRGSHTPQFLQRAATDAPPVWLHLPQGSEVAAMLHPSLQTMEVAWLHEARSLRATAACADAEAATAVRTGWLKWRHEHRCEPADPIAGDSGVTWGDIAALPPGANEANQNRLFFRRCVQSVTCTVESDRVQWTCDLSPCELADLVRLLSVPPLDMLAGG